MHKEVVADQMAVQPSGMLYLPSCVNCCDGICLPCKQATVYAGRSHVAPFMVSMCCACVTEKEHKLFAGSTTALHSHHLQLHLIADIYATSPLGVTSLTLRFTDLILQVMQPTRRCCKQVQSTSEALSPIWLTRLAVMHAA